MVPAPAEGGHSRCRPPRRRNLGEVSERVGEYRAEAPRRSRRCLPPLRPRSAFPAPGGHGPGSGSCPASPPLARGWRGLCQLAPRSRPVPEPLRERGPRQIPLVWAARRPSRAGTSASALAGAGTAGGGREFLSRPVLWVMEGVTGKRSLASEIWRHSFLQRTPLFCVDLDLKSRARMVV